MNVTHWNPVLFRGGNGTFDDEIILFFKVSKTIAMWTTMYYTSADNGKTRSEARELVEGDESGGRGPVKHKPIRISDGRRIAPRSVETPSTWTVQLDRSADKCKSWELLAPSSYVDNPAIRNGLASIKTNGVLNPRFGSTRKQMCICSCAAHGAEFTVLIVRTTEKLSITLSHSNRKRESFHTRRL